MLLFAHPMVIEPRETVLDFTHLDALFTPPLQPGYFNGLDVIESHQLDSHEMGLRTHLTVTNPSPVPFGSVTTEEIFALIDD